jgi:gliding motility-associated-like protein
MLCPETCFVPNSFTPNGDGNNDTFLPILEGKVGEYRFSIFNRYGQQVFSSTEPGKGWDGIFRSVQQIPGTYIWQLSYRFKNRKPQFRKGTVLLMR